MLKPGMLVWVTRTPDELLLGTLKGYLTPDTWGVGVGDNDRTLFIPVRFLTPVSEEEHPELFI